MMKNDILITGGHIIDPARNINEINNLRIINDIIVDADKYPVTSETRIIHADGMIVTPGLIDYHAHVFYDATGNDSNLLIVFYVQIMPDDFVMQLHR
ncbi:hypothetical protein ACTFB3_09710, partial [Salmonella sp. fjx14s1]